MASSLPYGGHVPSRTCRHHCTSDHTFTAEELEFLQAMEDFKKATNKKFPTWTDALNVLMGLGYYKPSSWGSEAPWSWVDPPESASRRETDQNEDAFASPMDWSSLFPVR